jgi:hypothetical protein
MPATAVLIVVGFQLPKIGVELVEIKGKIGAAEFTHSGPICKKLGLMFGAVISMSTVVVEAH